MSLQPDQEGQKSTCFLAESREGYQKHKKLDSMAGLDDLGALPSVHWS